MPKQLAEPKKSGLVPPDRAVLLARKEATQRVEALKLRLVVLVDRYFEQSVRIIKSWMQDDEKDTTKRKR
jgi:hypothetical protein